MLAAVFIVVATGVFGFIHYYLLACGNSFCADDLLGVALSFLTCAGLCVVGQVVMLVRLYSTGRIQIAVVVIYFFADAIAVLVLSWGVVTLYADLST